MNLGLLLGDGYALLPNPCVYLYLFITEEQ
jgi:hypothetical protein